MFIFISISAKILSHLPIFQLIIAKYIQTYAYVQEYIYYMHTSMYSMSQASKLIGKKSFPSFVLKTSLKLCRVHFVLCSALSFLCIYFFPSFYGLLYGFSIQFHPYIKHFFIKNRVRYVRFSSLQPSSTSSSSSLSLFSFITDFLFFS